MNESLKHLIKISYIKGRFHDIFFCSAQYFRWSTFHNKKCVLYLHLVLILKNTEIATSDCGLFDKYLEHLKFSSVVVRVYLPIILFYLLVLVYYILYIIFLVSFDSCSPMLCLHKLSNFE